MRGQILSLWKQALATFSSRKEEIHQNIEALRTLMNKITIDDVKFNPALLSNTIWEHPKKAPATYVDIYQDSNVTLGIFILKPGMLLPLHNHPEMHGLIKVLYGTIRITSYSIDEASTAELNCVDPTEMPLYLRPYLIVEKMSEVTSDSSSDSCVLYPKHKNLHEIESIGGPAAFMDILSPPYDTLTEEGYVRNCNYYKVLNELDPNVFKVQKVGTPSDFWTDSTPFISN